MRWHQIAWLQVASILSLNSKNGFKMAWKWQQTASQKVVQNAPNDIYIIACLDFQNFSEENASGPPTIIGLRSIHHRQC